METISMQQTNVKPKQFEYKINQKKQRRKEKKMVK